MAKIVKILTRRGGRVNDRFSQKLLYHIISNALLSKSGSARNFYGDGEV